jgi:putative nucleotidyltransferase with HDIG domain
MRIAYFRALRRRRARSRNGRAEEYSKRPRLRLRQEMYKGILPRITLLLLFVAGTVALFPPAEYTTEYALKAGAIADRTIIAPFDLDVPLSPEEVQVRKADALLKVLPVYARDTSIQSTLVQDLSELFDSLATVAGSGAETENAKVERVQALTPYLPRRLAEGLASPGRLRSVRGAAVNFQKTVFERGLVDNAGPLRARAYTEIAVIDGSEETSLPVENVIDQGSIDRMVREEAIRRFGDNSVAAQAFVEIVRAHLRPNLIFRADETQARRELAISQVEKTTRVSRNQRIISEHDKVSPEQEKVLAELDSALRLASGRASRVTVVGLYAGAILKLLLFGILVGGYVFAHRGRLYRDLRKFTAFLVVFMLYLACAAAVVRLGLDLYLIPVALVSVMITALFDHRLGLAATVFAAVLMLLVADVNSGIFFVSLLGGAAAVAGFAQMRARSHFYTVFAIVTAAYLVGIVAVGLGSQSKVSEIYTSVLWATANALFSSLAAMFLLPIFEAAFRITTRFTLLELTDLNKPILKRLNMEAPGTYHHAMLLGNLVDTVASDIGADPLKARVMAYYHDIGKLLKPEYYGENQEAGFNKHEKITPQMSKTILLSHVKDGVELARGQKLPDLVIDAIQQHHGTTVMAYFYQKALETDSHSSVNADDFRYPGPKPTSKEAALVMLADALESACRSLKDPTPANIRNMVIKLVNQRLQEGQLDESGFTLNEVARARERFVSILTSIYHKRVAYPGQEGGEGEAVAEPA